MAQVDDPSSNITAKSLLALQKEAEFRTALNKLQPSELLDALQFYSFMFFFRNFWLGNLKN